MECGKDKQKCNLWISYIPPSTFLNRGGESLISSRSSGLRSSWLDKGWSSKGIISKNCLSWSFFLSLFFLLLYLLSLRSGQVLSFAFPFLPPVSLPPYSQLDFDHIPFGALWSKCSKWAIFTRNLEIQTGTGQPKAYCRAKGFLAIVPPTEPWGLAWLCLGNWASGFW